MKKADDRFAIMLSVPLEMIIDWIGIESGVSVQGVFVDHGTRAIEIRLEHPSLPGVAPGAMPMLACPYGPWASEQELEQLSSVFRPNWNLREQLAELAHKQWSGWMEYLFRCGEHAEDGTFIIDAESVARWKRITTISMGAKRGTIKRRQTGC